MIRGGRFIGVVLVLTAAAFFGALGAQPLDAPPAGAAHGGAPIVTAIVLFVGFGGATWMMRRYFIKRAATKEAPSPVLATTTASLGAVDVLDPETPASTTSE